MGVVSAGEKEVKMEGRIEREREQVRVVRTLESKIISRLRNLTKLKVRGARR